MVIVKIYNMFSEKIHNEIFVRVCLFIVYKIIGLFNPITRKMQPEEIWKYRYPSMKSYCSMSLLWSLVCCFCLIILTLNYLDKKDNSDLEAALLSITLSVAVTATITRIFKYVTGKPRPDFFWRCFPNGYGNHDMICYGNALKIREGRQSFPSGHAALSFSSFGFITLYMMGKLRVYETKGNGESWRIIVSLLPIVLASIISLSRIVDYHHDGIDVFSGIILGSFVTLICYHHYYPPYYSKFCDIPYSSKNSVENS